MFSDRRAQFNRRYLNRIMRPLSGHLAMWSIVEHEGRRSGKVYRTPVSIFPTPDGLALLPAYGEDCDWVRNIQAAGGGRVMMLGKTFDVTDPRIVPRAEAAQLLRAPWRQILGTMSTPSMLLLSRADRDAR